MADVIKLGAPGSLRNYTLVQQGDSVGWDSGPAFPFSAKINTSNEFDEIDAWNEYLQNDWQQGVGRVDPLAGGHLYADIETRIPNELILSPLLKQVDKRTITGSFTDARFMPINMDGAAPTTGELFVSFDSALQKRVAVPFSAGTLGPNAVPSWIYAQIDPTIEVVFAIYTDTGTGPGTLIGNGTIYTAPNAVPGWYWHGVPSIAAATTPGTTYWLVVYPRLTGMSMRVGIAATGYGSFLRRFDGTTWNLYSAHLIFSTGTHNMTTASTGSGSGFFRFNNILYYFTDANMYKYDSANDVWTLVGVIRNGIQIASVATWGDKVYIGNMQTSNTDWVTMSTAEVFTVLATGANLFVKHGQFLYRSHLNRLYYSADGTTWTGPFNVGSSEFTITGMAGMGDSVYVATAEALYRFAPGNVVEGVSTWGSLDPTNGMGMQAYTGSIYCTVNGRVTNITVDGQIMDVWISRDDDVLQGRIGKVYDLAAMNNWLLALVSAPAVGGWATMWALQDGSWHHMATLPYDTFGAGKKTIYREYNAYYDRETEHVWMCTPGNLTYKIYAPDFAVNPYNDAAMQYMPRGWQEQDRFYGGQYLLNKDWESVRIVGENLSANVHVKIYWQDEDSTNWELLGSATSEQEVRWLPPYATRPAGKWIRLGVLLVTNVGVETPRVRAIIVKFLPKTVTKIQDTVTLSLKSNIQMPDGTPDTYTVAQQWAHVRSLIDSVPPFIYEDPEGVQREVQVTTWSRKAEIFAHEAGSKTIKQYTVMLVLRQVNDGNYLG